jgi:F-type H+-transporting ATPase subunit epsilon
MTFPLKIVTPDGLIFDGQADKLIVRTTTGDTAILARHINAVFPLGMGQAIVEADGQRRTAACIGGMLSVVDGAVTLVPTTFEWAEDIDVKRAESSAERAKATISNKDASDADIRLAQARLKRALVRSSVAKPM